MNNNSTPPAPAPQSNTSKATSVLWTDRSTRGKVGVVVGGLLLVSIAVSPFTDGNEATAEPARVVTEVPAAAETGAERVVTEVPAAAPERVVTEVPAPAPESVVREVPAPAPESVVAQAPAGDLSMFDATGMDLQLAQDTVQARLGIWYSDSVDASGQDRMQLWDRNWTVVGQDPAPGTPVTEDTEITFYVNK